MKRRIVLAAVFLLAGAVVNVAVAWGCAVWIELPPHPHYTAPSADQAAQWAAEAPRGAASAPLIYSVSAAPGFWQELLTAFAPGIGPVEATAYFDEGGGDFRLNMLWNHRIPNDRRVFDSVQRVQAGWPLPGLAGDRWLIPAATTLSMGPGVTTSASIGLYGTSDSIYVAAVPLTGASVAGSGTRLIPFRPIWPGFAANSVFYAAVLWLLIPGPFVLRRVIRVRRGLCPKCAYPMGASDVCSECGKTLSNCVGA